MLYRFGIMDYSRGWTQQFHFGALRNNNSRLFNNLGPDKGFDSIGDFELARPLSKFLNRLDSEDMLAKTILYNLNPRDNELIATMIGNFRMEQSPGNCNWFGLVVPRSKRWDGKTDECPFEPRVVKPFCRNADRFAKLPLLYPSRIFPPYAL